MEENKKQEEQVNAPTTKELTPEQLMAKDLAERTFKILASLDLPAGPWQPSDRGEMTKKIYIPLVRDIYLKENIRLFDLFSSWQFLQSIIDQAKDLVVRSVQHNLDITIAKIWGVENQMDLTFSQLDDKMKEVFAIPKNNPDEDSQKSS